MSHLSKEIQKFTLPLIANNLFQLIINQFILFLAVNQSIKNLAGITIIQSLLYAFGGIIGAVALSFNIEGGQLLGQRYEQKFLQLLKSSLVINTIIGLIFAMLILILSNPFLEFVYGFHGQLLTTANLYFLIQAPYIFLTLMMFLSSNLIKIENKTNLILIITVITTILEIIMNFFLVRILKLGVIGASISSIFTLALTVVLQFYVVRQKVLSALSEQAIGIRRLLKKSVPLGMQEILEGVIFIIFFEALIARLGVKILAIYALVAQIFNIVKMPSYMYQNAAIIFGSKAYGGKNINKIKKILKITLSYSLGFYFIFAIIFTINARFFVQIFSGNQLSNQFPKYLIIVLTSSICFVTYEITKGILQTMNNESFVLRKTFIVNIMMFLVMLVVQVTGFSSFQILYMIYGLSLLILSFMFLIKFSVQTKL